MHVLGIDAGGSKTVCFLADADGRIVNEGRGGGANLQAQGELEVEKTLHAVIEQAVGDTGIVPAAVCVGIAGVDREDENQLVRNIMRRLGFRTRTVIVNDALIALMAGARGDPGVVLIAGTGSIAYGVNADGHAARSGGWGWVIGDEGSGYWIGRHALAAVVRDADGRGPKTRLTRMVLDHFQLSRVDGLVHEIYDRGLQRPLVGALGSVVDHARAEGDVVAAEILRTAAGELTRAAESVIERLEMRGQSFPIVLSGGMFRVIGWLTDEVIRRLVEVAPRAVARRLDAEPAYGAVALALREMRGGVRIPVYIETSDVSRA